MAKDFTKYKVKDIDGTFGKSKLVLAILKHYCSLMNPSFEDLKKDFPDELQGKGVFTTIEEANKIAKTKARHYVNDPIKIKNATISVSNQWGTQIDNFISKAKEIGYEISTTEKSNSSSNLDLTVFDPQELNELFNKSKDEEIDEIDKEIAKLINNNPKYFIVGKIFEGFLGYSEYFDLDEVQDSFALEEDHDELISLLEEKSLIKRVIEKHGFTDKKIGYENIDFKLYFSSYFIRSLEILSNTENSILIAEFIVNQSIFAVREFDIDDSYGDWIADLTLDLIKVITGINISDYEGDYSCNGVFFDFTAEMGYDYDAASTDIIDWMIG